MDYPSLKIDTEALRKSVGHPELCSHHDKELRKKIDRLRKPRLHFQCRACGLPVGSRVSAKDLSDEQILELPVFDEALQQKVWAEYHTRYRKAEAAERERLMAIWRRRHNEYLATEEWKAKRALVLKRAGQICEGCRCAQATEVHHTTYENVGNEFLFQLVALCGPCHSRFHARIFSRFLEDLWIAGYGRSGE